MKVLHIFNEINFSGAEIMYANAAPLFQKEGLELIAINSGQKEGNFIPQFEAANIKIYYLPLPDPKRHPLAFVGYFRNIYLLIKKEGIDVLHIHRATFYWFFALCGYLAGVRMVRTVHNVFKNRTITWPIAFFNRFTSRKIFGLTFQTIGESVYLNELDYYKNPSVRINNWFDSKRFYPPINEEERLVAKEKIGIKSSTFVIISTGSCTLIKNHHDIIKALAVVSKQIDCVYLHLGHGKTEHEESELAKELGVQGKILFLGNKVNVRDYLIASDLFIMTSKFEGLGNAVLEAMACKLPSVLYDVPGLRDLIRNDDNGFLIDSSVDLLAKKITYFYDHPSVAREKGNNAFAFVTKEFSISNCVPQIVDLYKN